MALLSVLRPRTALFLFFFWVEDDHERNQSQGYDFLPASGYCWSDSGGQRGDTSAWAPALSSGYPVNQGSSGATQALVFSFLSPSTPFEVALQSLCSIPEKPRK